MRRFRVEDDNVRRVTRRVVVTGMGMVSPLGNTVEESWRRVIGSHQSNDFIRSSATTLEEALFAHQDLSPDRFDREWKIARSLPCQVVSPVRGLTKAINDHFLRSDSNGNAANWNSRTTARFVQMTLLAGTEAMQQSNLVSWLSDEADIDREFQNVPCSRRDRFGVSVGSGMSAVREISSAWDTVDGGSIRRLSPHFIPKVLTNSASGRLSLEFGLRGPNLAPSTACAASAHAIGDAVRAIRSGSADIMLAGGAEASIEPVGLAGFCRLRALSTSFNDVPEEASRPFDARRDGFVMGEGAAILVLEELEHAKERIRQHTSHEEQPIKILAEITGYAATGDAFHVTAPDEAGLGAERAMKLALQEDSYQSGNNHIPIGYINAHATSTPKGDEIEASVVEKVLRSHQMYTNYEAPCYLSSTKGASGHLLGAAGALEASFTIMSLQDQKIPPTLNLTLHENDDSKCTDGSFPSFKHATGNEGIAPLCDIQMAMSNSFGFGGTNASLVFRRYTEDA